MTQPINIYNYVEFHNCVETLITLNIERRESLGKIHPGIIEEIGILKYAQEFCTVQVNIGRRSGKTSFITKRAQNEDMLIVGRESFKRLYKEIKCQVISEYGFTSIDFDKDYNFVFIDEPKLVFEGIKKDAIYSKFATKTTTFVLLGE